MTTNILKRKDKEEIQAKGELTKEGLYFTPNVDIFETDTVIYLTMDMPGVDNNNIDINVKDNELQIQGYPKKKILAHLLSASIALEIM